jgi:GNAT superfamily N-acetyltransferase
LPVLASVTLEIKPPLKHHLPTSPKLSIRPAVSGDALPIAQIAARHALHTKTTEQAEREGFLVSGYSPDAYGNWIAQLDVADEGGAIVGFALSFRRAELPVRLDDLDLLLLRFPTEDFRLIKQVAVHPAHQGRTIGQSLYNYVLAKSPELPVAAAILLEPRNDRSIRFHEKMGFCHFFNFVGTDGSPRGFWLRDPLCVRS